MPSLEDRIANELGSMSVQLTKAVAKCASCETRLALQKVDIEDIRQAVLDLDEFKDLAQLQEQFGTLQEELAEVATELSLAVAVAEATTIPSTNNNYVNVVPGAGGRWHDKKEGRCFS